jgi:hypothetical protein
VRIAEGAEFASQVFCRISRIRTYSADPHENRSDPNQNRRPFLLVAGLLRGNWAIDSRLCRGCLSGSAEKELPAPCAGTG